MKIRWPWQKSENRSILDMEGVSLNDPNQWLLEAMGGGQSLSGEFVNQGSAKGETALGFCINILAEDLGAMDLVTYYDDGFERDRAVNHALYKVLMYAPNEFQTAIEWKMMTQRHLGGWGAAYSYIERDSNNDVRALLPLMPDRTYPCRNDQGKVEFVTKMNNGQEMRVADRDMLYINWFTDDGVTPVSPVTQFRETLGRDIAANRFGSRFFGNGAQLKGYIKVPEGLDLANPQRLRKNWDEVYGGPNNQFRTAVLEQGMDYVPVGVNPKDAQFIEAASLSLYQVANILRIPVVMLNRLERATWGNTNDLIRYYAKNTLTPWMKRYEQAIYMRLLNQPQRRRMVVEFDTSDLLRGDPEAEASRHKTYLEAGVITGNEVRRELGLNPMDGLNEPFKPNAQMVPGADEEPEEPDEPEAEEPQENDSRLLGLAHRTVERLVQLEVNTAKRYADDTDKLESYFAKHGERVADMLGISPEEANTYAEARWRDITERGGVQNAIVEWQKELPQDLLRILIDGN